MAAAGAPRYAQGTPSQWKTEGGAYRAEGLHPLFCCHEMCPQKAIDVEAGWDIQSVDGRGRNEKRISTAVCFRRSCCSRWRPYFCCSAFGAACCSTGITESRCFSSPALCGDGAVRGFSGSLNCWNSGKGGRFHAQRHRACTRKAESHAGRDGDPPDGYHTLDMIMQAVSLRERVTCAEAGDFSLLPGSRVPANELNTAYKAALAFLRHGPPGGRGHHGGKACARARGHWRAAAPTPPPFWGGAERAVRRALSAAELCALGAQVGLDVPFSISGRHGPGYRCGRYPGAAEALPALLFTVCMPAGGISTPQAYARYDRIGTDVRPDSAAAAAAIARGDLAGLCAQMKNALEYSSASAADKAHLRNAAPHGALAALMTGSGAAVFGVLQTRPRPRPRKRRAAAGLPTVLGAAAGGERCARRGARMRIKRCGTEKQEALCHGNRTQAGCIGRYCAGAEPKAASPGPWAVPCCCILRGKRACSATLT